MFQSKIGRFAALFLAGSLTIGMAASTAIGIVTAPGTFRVDNSTVEGNATLFEGTVVETGRVPSTLVVDGGAWLMLGAGSRGRVYRGMLVLEQGTGQIENASDFRLEAKNLRIIPSTSGIARVQYAGSGRVEVEAISGPVSVTTADGALVASLDPGNTLAFEPQAAGAAAPFHVTGCVQKTGDKFMLKDDMALVSFELLGSGLEKHVGKRVEITGTSPGKAEVIQVAGIKVVSGGCPVPTSAKKSTQKAGTAHMGPATKAIIAGVIVGSAGAGAAVALHDEPVRQPVSR